MLSVGIITAGMVLVTSLNGHPKIIQENKAHASPEYNEGLKTAAFEILTNKCNVCHKKQNSFMIFKLKNMEQRAQKIHQMVFVERRMPKREGVQLTENEYAILAKWLLTQKIDSSWK